MRWSRPMPSVGTDASSSRCSRWRLAQWVWSRHAEETRRSAPSETVNDAIIRWSGKRFSHSMCTTQKDEVNKDLLEVIKS